MRLHKDGEYQNGVCRFFANKAKLKEQSGLDGLGLFRKKLANQQMGAVKSMLRLRQEGLMNE